MRFFVSPAQSRQLPIVRFLGRCRLNPPHPRRVLAPDELLSMDPEPMAQLARIAAVGLLLRPARRLRDDDLHAAVTLEHFQEPRIHAADLDDGHQPAFRPGLVGKIGKKRPDLLPPRAHLPLEDHFPIFAANIHRQLTLVLVDTEV